MGKITIRLQAFETNSSSSHSLVLGDEIDMGLDPESIVERPELPTCSDDESDWDEYYALLSAYEEARLVLEVPGWHPVASESHDWSDDELDFTLEDRVTFLCHLGHQSDVNHLAQLHYMLQDALPGVDIEAGFSEVSDSGAQFFDADDAARIIDDLSEGDALERFLFSSGSTVRSSFGG